ncbi:MAG: valine--tRNA ligase, partial [Patescibacteria group bacterium]
FMSTRELSPQYNPKEVEEKIYRMWEESGFFNPDNLPGKRLKTYTIVMAPPNITGSLHMGHALEYTLSDILIRYKRMSGHKTLWLPGTDHAGIATQNVVEKELKKQGVTRHDIGREKLIEKIWEWKEKYGYTIINQLKKIGSSADWSRLRFTMDANYQDAVKTAFLHYHKKGLIYQGERTVNWCPRCQTSLSDLEVEHKEENGVFYYIKYGPFTVGTVRPETKLGDTALAVNPNDKRYKDYVGKEITIRSVNSSVPADGEPKLKDIKIKVVADNAADPEFGTGIIKVTPAHDQTDFEIHERHPEVLILKVIDEKGRMNENAGIRYQGLKVAEAREKIVDDLTKLGLMEKTEEYKHNVSICYRCGTIIEPLLSKQWFLKMGGLAVLATRAVKSGKVKFHPKRWEKVYFDWLKNVKDWCISRQIWWGHKIPLDGVDDVLDTWFSSALWPFATLGWPQKTTDLKTFYPADVNTNDRGIINLWDMRMVFSGLEFMKQVPFKDNLVHATILTKDGRRMSKSLGTGIDPMDPIERYGADATRFGLIWQAMGNQDIHWSEEHIIAGKKFANKIWNASRFVLMTTDKFTTTYNHRKKKLTEADKQMIQYITSINKGVSKYIDGYNFGLALHDLYDFFWHEFCDIYIEAAKKQLQNEDTKENTKEILSYGLYTSLKLLHPFMPHITEEIWSILPAKNKKMLIVEEWPQ